jgi:RNA-binding protein Musashi
MIVLSFGIDLFIGSKLFVGGLKRATTREAIKAHFSQFGEVLECNLVKDPISQVSRGFGFITFTHPKAVDRVMKQDHFLDEKLVHYA